MTYDPQDSTPYEDEDLIREAKERLGAEWRDMTSARVLDEVEYIREGMQEYIG